MLLFLTERHDRTIETNRNGQWVVKDKEANDLSLPLLA